MVLRSRRQAIALLGLGATTGLISAWRGRALGAASGAGRAQLPPVTFPRGAVIRTLLKDLPPEALAGKALLFHEHLSLHNGRDDYSDDVGVMVEEVKAAGRDGVGCIVDGGHADMFRRMENLRRIAAESGVSIVACGGYYLDRTYPPDLASKSADEIADDLVREAKAERYGAFGEIGQEGGVLTDKERKVFQAIAKAQVRTGLPIFTHNPYAGSQPAAKMVPPEVALRQLDVLEGAGGDPRHIAIGHVCCLDDPKAAIPIQLAKRGVFVGFDRATSPRDIPGTPTIRVLDTQKAVTIMAMVEADYADHVLLSSDFSHGESLRSRGGPGVGMVVTVFGPILRKAGMPEATLRSIFENNSRRFLAFVPKQA